MIEEQRDQEREPGQHVPPRPEPDPTEKVIDRPLERTGERRDQPPPM